MPTVPDKVTLNLTLNNANIILNALAEQPWRIANEVIVDVRQQILKQVNPGGQENNVSPFVPGNVG
jgi:hypothetical protein